MKVYISCNGLGLGHVGRSLAYADKLRDRGDEVIFATWGPAVDFAKRNGYKCYKLPKVNWYDRKDGSLDLMKTTMISPILLTKAFEQSITENLIIIKEKPDIIVSDSNFTTNMLANILLIPSIFLTHQITFKQSAEIVNNIFDFFIQMILLNANKVCINDFRSPDNIYPLSVLKKKKAVYIGPLIRTEPDKMEPRIKNEKKQCFILISGPKKSPHALEKQILSIEEDLQNMDDWQFFIVSPSKQKDKDNIKYVQWLDDIYSYLNTCDVFVSRSGYSTVCDALAYRKKSIFIPQINQSEQELIASNLKNRHLCSTLSQKDIKKLPKLIRKVHKDTDMQNNLNSLNNLFTKFPGADQMIKVIDELV
ncbi:MAG: hypothetical protein KAJ54_00750 [Candidatus Aenigmarchaeota archaeon]|nr:hypothetical protein [Candidatus Aenigmarchaeota archaeon]